MCLCISFSCFFLLEKLPSLLKNIGLVCSTKCNEKEKLKENQQSRGEICVEKKLLNRVTQVSIYIPF